MVQTPTPITADFCSFDEYKKIEGTKRTIGFCNNDVTTPSDFSDSGYVEIKETGIYTFLIESDDGATLNVSGNSVSDSGPHSLSEKTLTVFLEAGFHRLEVTQYDIGATQREDGSWTHNSSALYVKWGNGSPGGTYKSGNTPGSTPSSWASVPLWEIERKTAPSLEPSAKVLYINSLEPPLVASQEGEIKIYGDLPDGCKVVSSNEHLLFIDKEVERSENTGGYYGLVHMHAVDSMEAKFGENFKDVTAILCDATGAPLTQCTIKTDARHQTNVGYIVVMEHLLMRVASLLGLVLARVRTWREHL